MTPIVQVDNEVVQVWYLRPTSRGYRLVRRQPLWTTGPVAENWRRPGRSTLGRPSPSTFDDGIGDQLAPACGWSARGPRLPKREAEPTDVPMRPLWVYKDREANGEAGATEACVNRPKAEEIGRGMGRAPCRHLPSDHDTIDPTPSTVTPPTVTPSTRHHRP